ncbi:hypothetical protein AeRB84_003638 [Aphanomyces euteiches]|nr:hypothetical protein AeRB84_003638 [Aphanomyces euteiches]
MLSASMAVCWLVKETSYTFESPKSKYIEVIETFGAVYTGIRDLPRPLAVYFIIMMLTQCSFSAYNSAKGQFFGLVVNQGLATDADLCHENCSPAQKKYNDGVQLGGQTDVLLVKRFGATLVVTLAIIPQAFLIFLAFCRNIPLVIVFASGVSITQATVFPLALPLVLHVLDDDSQFGLFAGALNSSMCFGQFLNFALGTLLVRSSMGYATPLLVGGVLSAIACLIVWTQFHVNMH